MQTTKKVLQTTDGSKIYYEVSGQGTPLFLLHGNNDSGQYFTYQVPAFSQFFQVYVIDSRGHGRSTNNSNYLSFRQMAQDLNELIEKENLKKIDIVGFSDGANLAMTFAVLFPQKTDRLVLNSGNTLRNGVNKFAQLATLIEYWLFRFIALFNKKFRKRVLIIELLLQNIGISESDLKTIQAKTLIIVGKYDVIKRAHSLYLAETIPHATFVLVPYQGHSFAKKRTINI
ncbi:alpha/beta hydrolase fold [Melissococcus plutonius DAT561]|nr:alpha/beta hydrolase fold [Melissococcus plutonius DAT561]